jgi:hypothetical protein
MANLSLAQVIARIEQIRGDYDGFDSSLCRAKLEALDACLILLRQQQEQERVEKRPVCPSCHKATTISQLLQYGACCDCSEGDPYDSEAI